MHLCNGSELKNLIEEMFTSFSITKGTLIGHKGVINSELDKARSEIGE